MGGMRHMTALFLVLVLAGCAVPYTDYIADKPIAVVPARIVEFKIEDLHVYTSGRHPLHVWVEPTRRNLALMMAGEQTKWAAMQARVEPVYREAVLKAMQKNGTTCEVRDPVPFPEYFAIEYTYSCR